jgi:hypothetical protein
VRIRALGAFVVDDPAADQALGRGQARELLALLVAHRGQPLATEAVVDALWGAGAPPTAATIVHGAVARLRKVLGPTAVSRSDAGYVLEPAGISGGLDVDLWELHALADAGRLVEARAMVVEPILGAYEARPWAVAALARLRARLDRSASSSRRTRRRDLEPAGRLVGRRRELAALWDAHRRSRLVTVVGVGGVGKSRLAAELVEEVDGAVSRVDLGLAGGSFAARLAAELGAVASQGDAALVAVAALLGDTTSVLVLDGCEHDIDGAADTIPFLLQRCPRLSVVATSRVALGLPGEQVVPLLPFADPADPLGDGVELLLDRLRALGLLFDPDDRERATAICARCAGVPLAIELAAAEVLSGEVSPASGDGPGAAVAAVIDQALRGLAPATAVAAQRAASLPAGVTPAILARLHEASAAMAARDLLAAGLVAVDGTGAQRRLRFPDPVRESLLARCDVDDVLAAADVLGGLAAGVRPEVDRVPDLAVLADTIGEITNAHGLLDALAQQRRTDERLALALAFGEAWREDGHWITGSTELERALLAAEEAGPVEPAVRARAVYYIVTVAGTYEVASRWVDELDRMAGVSLDAGLPELATAMRVSQANGLGYAGRIGEAWHAVQQARAASAASASPTVHLWVNTILASSQLIGGDPVRARHELAAISEEAVSFGGWSDSARIRRLASIAARTAGDLPGALADAELAEELASKGLARGTLAIVRGEIADLRFTLDPASAPPAIRSALATASSAGQLRMAGVCRFRLGLLEKDCAAVAEAAADLLAVDARWAALALTHLVERRPDGDPLRELVKVGVGSLTWGMPLSADDQRRVDTLAEGSGAPPRGWSDELRAALLGNPVVAGT